MHIELGDARDDRLGAANEAAPPEIIVDWIQMRSTDLFDESLPNRSGNLHPGSMSTGMVDSKRMQPRSKSSRSLPPVISIVAKSGTGKTTLLENLLPELRDRGLRVGVLKHHCHVSSFDVPGKDTYRLAAAGADVVVGASPVQVAVFRQEDGSGDLDAVIADNFAGMDVVLTEGYKRGSYPKIEVHREARSTDLLCQPDELLAIATDCHWDLPIPQFALSDSAGLGGLIARHVEQQR